MAIKRKTRMYEPWGYVDENNYQGAETILDNDLESFFAQVEYKREDNKIHFANKDGEEKATLDVSEFVKSDSIVEKAWYEDGKIYIKFTNGDVITVDVEELIDQNEFAAGLQVNDGIVSVLINAESDDYISVDTDGIKLTGVKADIEAEEARAISAETALDEKIDAEIARATAEEQRIDAKLDKEITDRIADVDEEEDRATEEETTIKNTIGGGFSTASTETVTAKFNALATALDTEIGNRTTQDNQLQNNINTESTARQAADTRLENLITDERNRALGEEVALKSDIEAEESRATVEEQRIDAKLDQEIADRIADVDAEEIRAKAAELGLQDSIDQEILDRKAEAVASAEYVKNDVKIYLKNDNGETLSEIDCTDFIVDGMIEDVELVESGNTSVLVITWNTDGGSKETTIDVGDIFEADNYYTKTDINSMVQVISDRIDAEETRATSAETNLQTAIEAEVTRAEAAEALKANSAEVDAALALKADKTEIPTDFYTKGEIDGKETALQAGINANADAIELKADKADVYTQEEVNVMMSQLLTRIKNLEEKESIVVADTAAEVAAAPEGSNVVIASTEAIQALTAGTEYSSITIVGGNANNGDIKAKATDKLTIDGMTINGDKGASNGRVLISASTIDLKNVTIETGSTAYNVFEGSQNTTDSNFFTRNYNVSNMTVDNTELNHNVLNIYTLADDAVINVKDSYFNLHPEKSNVLRLANYTNATGVTVNFENVDWTYENGGSSDFGWAGLIIYQPAASDVARTGDTSNLATWTFNFKNCKYNGEVVDSVNFGEHNQVIYGYGINGGGVSDLSSIATINFE